MDEPKIHYAFMLRIYGEHLHQGVMGGVKGKKTLHKSKHQSVTSPPLL